MLTHTESCRPSYQWWPIVLSLVTLLIATIVPLEDVSAQTCNRKSTTLHETPVYATPAENFNTATGWVYGSPVAVLAPGVEVRICGTRTVRFGLAASLEWTEIAYWVGQQWARGWVVSRNLTAAVSLPQASAMFSWLTEHVTLISTADAQPVLISEGPPADAPPPTAEPLSTGHAPPQQAAPSATASGLMGFYFWLFIFMLAGMVGKVLFDVLTSSNAFQWRSAARAVFLPVVVSPIVFLSIMKVADATATASIGSFFAVCCTAFQNGFFWQTLLNRLPGK